MTVLHIIRRRRRCVVAKKIRAHGIYRHGGGNTAETRARERAPLIPGPSRRQAARRRRPRPNAHRQLVGRHVRRRARVHRPCVRSAAATAVHRYNDSIKYYPRRVLSYNIIL